MPLNVIPFPNIDPVLISIGPFAIRWYALAYIVGILGGWFYARAIVRSEALWGGKAPLTVTDYDDFIVWATLGIILGGRIGYVLFYNAPLFRRPSGSRSCSSGRAACRSTAGFSAASPPWCCSPRVAGFRGFRSATSPALSAPIGLFLGRLANFINAELWGRVDRRAMGDCVS